MVSIQIEIPETLLKQLQEAGVLHDPTFMANALTHELARQQNQESISLEERLIALDEMCGMFADESWTMEDIYQMKREEKAIEERK